MNEIELKPDLQTYVRIGLEHHAVAQDSLRKSFRPLLEQLTRPELEIIQEALLGLTEFHNKRVHEAYAQLEELPCQATLNQVDCTIQQQVLAFHKLLGHAKTVISDREKMKERFRREAQEELRERQRAEAYLESLDFDNQEAWQRGEIVYRNLPGDATLRLIAKLNWFMRKPAELLAVRDHVKDKQGFQRRPF